jgi:hypothetical protein
MRVRVCVYERERERKNLIKLLTENMPADFFYFNVTTLWVGKSLLCHNSCLLPLNANAPCITALLYFVFTCCVYSTLGCVSYVEK